MFKSIRLILTARKMRVLQENVAKRERFVKAAHERYAENPPKK